MGYLHPCASEKSTEPPCLADHAACTAHDMIVCQDLNKPDTHWTCPDCNMLVCPDEWRVCVIEMEQFRERSSSKEPRESEKVLCKERVHLNCKVHLLHSIRMGCGSCTRWTAPGTCYKHRNRKVKCCGVSVCIWCVKTCRYCLQRCCRACLDTCKIHGKVCSQCHGYCEACGTTICPGEGGGVCSECDGTSYCGHCVMQCYGCARVVCTVCAQMVTRKCPDCLATTCTTCNCACSNQKPLRKKKRKRVD
jgi:hypothetical protein